MDNNSLAECMISEQGTGNEIKNIELATLIEQPTGSFVPKIRIRLRPQLVKSSSLDNANVLCNSSNIKQICDKVELIQPYGDINNMNSETRCYKTLEDSGGGGDNETTNHFKIHGINLRSRPQKSNNNCQKPKSVNKNKKFNLLTKSKNKDFLKSKLKPMKNKGVYQTFMLKTSKNMDELDQYTTNNKLSRKQINKCRNETLLSNINLKDIINQDNFLKFPSDVQWQLVNLLPNCDKPKLSSEADSCKCTDFNYNSTDNCPIYPNLGFSVLNNEFLGKALTKFSLKMGQCDLINILNSERENLRSRPQTILNEEGIVKSSIDNEIEVIGDQTVNACNEENNEILDEVKSHSSATTTDTVEMNGISNVDDKTCIELQDNLKLESCDNCKFDISKNEKDNNGDKTGATGDNSLRPSVSMLDNVKSESVTNENPECLSYESLIGIKENISSPSLPSKSSAALNDSKLQNPEFTEETKRKRGRKRKIFNSNDIQITPIKRSNRSTAGKRPARLDSESPPTSPNNFLINEKKPNVKCKKYKDSIHGNKKHKMKFESCDEQIDNMIKYELKSSKKVDISLDSSKQLKIFPSSPDSLFSHTESDLSPLSKPSPNGNGLLNNFIRSNLVSGHINSVQTLSPSWSCTSESTTPSAKSDYGHSQPIKPNAHTSISVSENQDTKIVIDSDAKPIQRMPPPRQTLTLAAMREKMRAKKLAKEDNRKISNTNNRKSSTFLSSQRHKKNFAAALKEGDDDFKLMEKIINNSEDIDDLLNNSQESILEFFTGNNYEFDTTSEQTVNINSINLKSSIQKKCNLKSPTVIKEKTNKMPFVLNDNSENNIVEKNVQTNKILSNDLKSQYDKIITQNSENPLNSIQINKELPSVEKSVTDTISYVFQKLNLSKDNGILSQISPGKSSHPNAYLVDSNGLTTALSIIQSLNPGAKVTTQQFYLVNSGPQLILQPSPPLAIGADKVTTTSTALGFQSKVSLAPKMSNSSPTVSQLSNTIREHLPHNNNSHTGVSINPVTYNPILSDKTFIQAPDTTLEYRSSSSLKVPLTDAKNTFMVSSITPNISPNQPRSLHLQTISTPQQIGFVQPVQQSLPSLFPSQLRFMQPSLSNVATSNTISFLASNNASCNASIVNTNQQPKLLFLCPTVPNNSNLVTSPNVLNQDQKYLLLSKQPDKQPTIQLVSSQGLWQQLNPNIISQPNNVLVMQSQPINTVYESLICPNTFLPAVSPINSDYSINERKMSLSCDIPQISTSCIFKDQQNKQSNPSIENTSSSLIIDSRSFNVNSKIELTPENSKSGRLLTTTEGSMTISLANHSSPPVNSSFSFFQSAQLGSTTIANENHCNSDEINATVVTEKFKNLVSKPDQPELMQSSQDINLS